jgi:hypothetical protein
MIEQLADKTAAAKVKKVQNVRMDITPSGNSQ